MISRSNARFLPRLTVKDDPVNSFRHPTWKLASVLLVAFAVRLVASAWWQARIPAGERFGFPDSDGYWELAEDLASGRPYEYQDSEQRIFRTPGYPILLGTVFWVLGPEASEANKMASARLLSVLLGTASVGILFCWAKSLLGERTGLLAGFAAALHPEVIGLGVYLLSEAPFVPLMLLHLWGWSVALACPKGWGSLRIGLGAGIAGGLATLCRPSWLLFVPFSVVCGLLVCKDRRWQVAIAGMLLMGQVVVLLPWWVRNWQVAGRFVPTSLQVGASLYDGLSPVATGASDMRFVPEFRKEQRQADAKEIAAGRVPQGIFEDRLDERMKKASFAWAKGHPKEGAHLWWIKLQRMWAPWPNANEFRSFKVSLVLAAGYIPLMLAVGMGMFRAVRSGAWKNQPWMLVVVLPAMYFTGLHTIFVSSLRYRQPALLPLMLIAVWGLCGLWEAKRESTSEAMT